MQHKNKRILTYLVPAILLDLFRFLRLNLKNATIHRLLRPNKKWKNVYLGEKVFIIANGPSLNMVDKKIFNGHKVVVMNSFDKASWKGDVDIVAHCIGEPFLEKSWIKESIIRNIMGTNSLSYWLHYSSKNKLGKLNKDEKIFYIFPCLEAGLWNNKKIMLESYCLGYQTTAQMAIMVALYMGFKEIALVGFDHDWLASPEYSKHFFSDEKEEDDVLSSMSYYAIIQFMQRMWHIYYKLKKTAENDNVFIYNISPKTFLDVFDKQTIL